MTADRGSSSRSRSSSEASRASRRGSASGSGARPSGGPSRRAATTDAGQRRRHHAAEGQHRPGRRRARATAPRSVGRRGRVAGRGRIVVVVQVRPQRQVGDEARRRATSRSRATGGDASGAREPPGGGVRGATRPPARRRRRARRRTPRRGRLARRSRQSRRALDVGPSSGRPSAATTTMPSSAIEATSTPAPHTWRGRGAVTSALPSMAPHQVGLYRRPRTGSRPPRPETPPDPAVALPDAREHLRRHRGRRRPQRPRRRRLPGPGGQAHRACSSAGTSSGGAAVTEQPWGPDYKVTMLSYVVSLLPPTILRDLAARAPRLQGLPAGPVLRAVPGRPLPAAARRPGAPAGRDRQVLRPATPTPWSAGTRGSTAWPTCSARCSRRSRRSSAAARRRTSATRPAWRGSCSGLGVRGVADVTRLFSMSVADLLEDYFESPADAGRAVGVGRHRHVGRAPLTGHRVRDGPPQDRRRGRRRARLVGLPRGRHGRPHRRPWPPRPARFGAEIRTEAPVARITTAGGPGHRRGARGRRGADGAARRDDGAPEDRLPRSMLDRAELPADFVDDIERWNTRSGTVKINLAVDRLPEFTVQARLRPRGARRHDRAGPLARRGRDGLPGRRRRPGRRAALRRHLHPVGVRPARWRPRASTSCRCSPSGCRRSGPTSRWTPSSTPTPTASSATVEEVAPGFAASILHRKVIGPYEMEHEYGLDRRQHLPRRAVAQPAVPPAPGGRLRRLPHARRRALPGRLGHPRRRRRHRHPRAAGRAPDRAGRTRRPLAARRPGVAGIALAPASGGSGVERVRGVTPGQAARRASRRAASGGWPSPAAR